AKGVLLKVHDVSSHSANLVVAQWAAKLLRPGGHGRGATTHILSTGGDLATSGDHGDNVVFQGAAPTDLAQALGEEVLITQAGGDPGDTLRRAAVAGGAVALEHGGAKFD